MTVSTTFTTNAYQPQTGDAILVLLTIDHADFVSPIRVVNNTEDITSNGDLYTRYPFDITLPENRENAPQRARLVIDNVETTISASLRNIASPPTVQADVIRASAPDTIEVTFPEFVLRNVRWDASKISGDLMMEDIDQEPFPAHEFSPAYFPGIF